MDRREGSPEAAPRDAGTPGGMSPGDEAPPGMPGTGENLCPACSGNGRLQGGETCQTCDGTGLVTEVVGGGG